MKGKLSYRLSNWSYHLIDECSEVVMKLNDGLNAISEKVRITILIVANVKIVLFLYM